MGSDLRGLGIRGGELGCSADAERGIRIFAGRSHIYKFLAIQNFSITPNIPLIAAYISRLGSFCSTMSYTRMHRILRGFARCWQIRKPHSVMRNGMTDFTEV
jgi:hypothetical protein